MSRRSTTTRTRHVHAFPRRLRLADKGQIWALTVSADEKTIVSAGADSIATIWEDSTEVEQAEKNEALIKAVQRWVV